MSDSRRKPFRDTVSDSPPDMFEMESEVFKTMFEMPAGDTGAEGETDELPIVLPSVSVPEMEALLRFFYFR
jgi:hypothetical protein